MIKECKQKEQKEVKEILEEQGGLQGLYYKSNNNEYTYNTETGKIKQVSDKGGEQYDIIHYYNGKGVMELGYEGFTAIYLNPYHYLNGAWGYNTPDRVGPAQWIASKVHTGAIEADGLGLFNWIGIGITKKYLGSL